MTDERHLAILRRGVSAWNAWRAREPTDWPDLSHAHLGPLHLDGIDLQNANLLGADLDGASLERANFRNANLKEAKLSRTNLLEACLTEANLYKADLASADLRGADLRFVNLSRASLLETRFQGAILGSTDFGNGDLSETVGLDQIDCRGEVNINVVTLERTALALRKRPHQRRVLDSFYRMIDLPQALLAERHQNILSPTLWRSCFISYSRQDVAFADRLLGRLHRTGVPCFIDEKDLLAGEVIVDRIESYIASHDRLLLCCSESSLTSQWVSREIEIALRKETTENETVLLPLDLDGYLFTSWQSDYAPEVRGRLAVSFRGWKRDDAIFYRGFDRVADALRLQSS